MKKIIIYAILSMICNGVIYAQHVQVSHPRDTINYPDSNYFFPRWVDSIGMTHPTDSCWNRRVDNGGVIEMAVHQYTDTPLNIIGIAAAIWTSNEEELMVFLPPTYRWTIAPFADSTFDNWVEYLRLYDATDTGLVLLAEGGYNALDTARCLRSYFNVNLDNSHGGWDVYTGQDTVKSTIVPIYEVFFEKPITVTDSFYVASTNYHCAFDEETQMLAGWEAMLECVLTRQGWRDATGECLPQLIHTQIRDGGGRTGWWMDDSQFCIWAIMDTTPVMVDTCKTVSNIAVEQDSAGAYIAWQGGDHNRKWQVAYGRADEDPEGYAVFNTTSESFSLLYLIPGVEYAVRVRGNCFDDTTFSDWSDTVRFVRQGTPADIDEALQPCTSVTPNPASSRVTVTSAFDISRITFYDMQGRAVLSTEAQGLTATLNVQGLPAGSYVVGITTSRGLSTRKLVIER